MGVVVVSVAILSGTRPLDLIRGLFIDPARYSSAFTIPIAVQPWVVGWGVICLAGAVLYRRFRSTDSSATVLDAFVHVSAGLLILYCALQEAQLDFTNTFLVALPLLFLAAIPPRGASESERIARLALVSLAVLEGLLAYPVAGAQVRWSSLLLVPVGMLCLHDGVRQLHPTIPSARLGGRRVVTGLVVWALVFAATGWFASVYVGDRSVVAKDYDTATPLRLPGSDKIRLPASQTHSLEALSDAIRAHCSAFLTLPALDSLYFWTGESPPTNWFNTYFYTGDAPRQKQIVRTIERHDQSRFCVVDNPTWTAFWAQGHILPQLPLARLVERFERNNNPPMVFDGYRLFVSHGAA